jgi:O-acetylhomoserine/O-acetylserine sulfhydrylase-like pyridoxal-dependent enzyme
MKPEAIAIHSSHEVDPTTKAVAVPIYQTVAYAFDSADHAAALFNFGLKASATPASRTRLPLCLSASWPHSKAGWKRCASPAARPR